MNYFKNKINKFFKGWKSYSEYEIPKTFFKYIIRYPLNWLCFFGCILFIGLFIQGGVKYESPLIGTSALFPLLILIYNFVDEYYAFQWYITGARKIRAKVLLNIFIYSCSAVMLYLIIRTFITG